jgi:hypothetical protein
VCRLIWQHFSLQAADMIITVLIDVALAVMLLTTLYFLKERAKP